MSKINTFILQGKESFSISKLEQLNLDFNISNNKNSKISSNEIYIIAADDEDLDLDQLKNILAADISDDSFSFIFGPRSGTISPWSTKTEDIIKNVGIKNIQRVEKFNTFTISDFSSTQNMDLSMFYDRMTQSIYLNHNECLDFLKVDAQRDVNLIDILSNGIKALQEANKTFGFAMSEEEITYLHDFYSKIARNPTDAELMMFAQANSEHCRHKIFNAKWSVNGLTKDNSLFDLIKETSKQSPKGIISAYKDNAAITEGKKVERLHLDQNNSYSFVEDSLNSTIKVETHNHPTAISPYPGAATGSGGEIRDEGATGRGAKPKIGLVGFNVSHLRIPQLPRNWEGKEYKPERIANPLKIMIEAPIGAAAFNNEFGRPSTLGYFRSFETNFNTSQNAFGYHKPIMLAGGIGEIRDKNNFKLQISEGYHVVVLGGPAMLIGLGGGAASSVSSGESDEDLDFASVQRDNAEMERRCQEVINICSSQDDSYIEFIHDVGAGGLSNAIPELAKDSNLGVYIELDKIPNSDKSMSPMEIWSNESQERYVMAIHPKNKEAFEDICKRERCVYAFVGITTEEKSVKLFDSKTDSYPVDVPLSMLFGDLPITDIKVSSVENKNDENSNPSDYSFEETLHQVLQHPTVASKSFLITIGDRTVGGMVARDQFIGPYQVPVSDYSMSLRSYTSSSGEVLTVGEKPTIAINNPGASMRMAMAEALLNMSGVHIKGLDEVQVSANWMAATGEEVEDISLREGVEALSSCCVDLEVSVPVGKDSLSMRTKWNEGEDEYVVKSPLSGVITAMAPVEDVRVSVTPELNTNTPSQILHIRLNNKTRLSGSIFSQVTQSEFSETPDIDDVALLKAMFNSIQELVAQKKVLALHDISDGGLITTLLEMAFTKKIGLNLSFDQVSSDNLNSFLFSEEAGLVIQVADEYCEDLIDELSSKGLTANLIGQVSSNKDLVISLSNKEIYRNSVINLEKHWREVSHAIQSIRDNESIANSELKLLDDTNHKGLFSEDSFDENALQSFTIGNNKPKVAILREQGVNGQMEMAAAFSLAGFEAVDVHMQDLLDKQVNLKEFKGMAACGGFSYGDVLGAGGGWSKTILHNAFVKDQFEEFFNSESTFTLGVCNGCQMVSKLKDIIPGADLWPSFEKNLSDQFEARLAQVKVQKSDSILLSGMEGWSLPIASAHGEGFAKFSENNLDALVKANQLALNFVDSSGNKTEAYPLNPNGSVEGTTGITAANGRVTIMMPHPERVFRKLQMSWRPNYWKEFSPWMQIFINARKFSE
ncbi:phosphoribosylformylglycinamidine synthase [Gammaproteobacteria bacterium]|nr:phosphoribosylformylglycinamidine synthase [Gammaproteobacteria bacterium]